MTEKEWTEEELKLIEYITKEGKKYAEYNGINIQGQHNKQLYEFIDSLTEEEKRHIYKLKSGGTLEIYWEIKTPIDFDIESIDGCIKFTNTIEFLYHNRFKFLQNKFKDDASFKLSDGMSWLISNYTKDEKKLNIQKFFNEDEMEKLIRSGKILNKKLIKDKERKEVKRNITIEQRYACLKRQKWRCNFCNERLKFNTDSNWKGEIAHIDHIHPFSKRDTYINGAENINEDSNIQALCPKCNLGKNKKEIN